MILFIGEILADMIGKENNGLMSFERYPGGAPFNAASGALKLGASTGFIGSVGDDLTGYFLKDFAESEHFHYLNLRMDKSHNTTLAFVENDENGERHFKFNRLNTADYRFDKRQFNKIKDADIISLGSLMLSEKEGRKSAEEIVRLSKENHKILSFDVNYRDDIYSSPVEAKEISLKYIKEADIVKMSADEIELLSDKKNLDDAVASITNENQLVLLTLGSIGSRFYYKGDKETVPTIKVKPVDTTGAGDAFYAATLAFIDEAGFNNLGKEILMDILKKANIAGAFACTKKGAVSALPSREELNKYL